MTREKMFGRLRAAAKIVLLAATTSRVVAAQDTSRVSVHVVRDTIPISGALVRAGAARARTNAAGDAMLRLPAGPIAVIATRIGFRPDSVNLSIHSGADTSLTISLVPQPAFVAPVFVTSTRAERRLEEEPLRIEVLGGDDVSEKSEMRPADSRTLLSEMSGVRVQTRSPLGATNLRIQGLPGRYAAVLNDGLPLFGGQASGFTLVDVVPLDLRQAEVIKGAASALYGPQALSGVVNLISRRPPDTNQVLVNQSAPSSTDVMTFLAPRINASSGLTVLGGLHQQRAADTDGDGWTDVAGFRRAELRPRLFVGDSSGHSLMLTAGGFTERRSAGSAAPQFSFVDSLATAHADAGAIGTWRASDALSFSSRLSFSDESRHHRFGDALDRDTRRSGFGEITATQASRQNVLVAGAATLWDTYANADVPRLNATYSTPGLFVQDTYTPSALLSATLNGRCDRSNIYGTFCTPRASVLLRPATTLSARFSAGTGWFAPRAVTDETETFAMSRVFIPAPLAAERARTTSLDITATRGPLQVNGTLFDNRVENPVGIQRVASDTTGGVNLVNAAGPLRTHGGELFAVFNQEPFVVTAYYAATRSREISTETTRLREVPLTPRETAGMDFALEDDESGAYAALEIFYTGRQALEDNPYASVSKPFTTLGVLLSDRWRNVTIFANGENLTNVRLTRFHPLVRPRVGEGGRWTVDPWAPLEGRRINVGLRWQP